MKRILSFLLLITALPIFQGCITDTKTETPDTVEVGPNGERKPRTPKVTYITLDSLVLIQITGTGPGQEDQYWIRRDGKLLEQPSYRSVDTVQNLYVLLDSLTEIGVHKYYVQFGAHPDSLSEKSTEYVYDYAGRSRSGRVLISVTQEQLVGITIQRPMDEVLGAFIIERKIGAEGSVEALDTVQVNLENFDYFLDTALVPDDTYLYYRVKALDAITEEYLPPSPWDSILVKNKVWKYVPVSEITVSENGIQAGVSNPLNYPDNGNAYYYLYRNASAEKSGKTKVDSIPISGAFRVSGLHDEPDTGDYYYWVEARDPWGRTSARSTPKLVRFSGKAMGPAVLLQQVDQRSIYVQPYLDEQAAYYILQRAQDTTKAPKILDTVPTATFYPYNTTFVDYPNSDGVFYYRAISIRKDGRQTDPGPWVASGFFHFDPAYGNFPATIVNRGDRVQCQVERLSDYYYILFRSTSASSDDTGAVDTLWYSGSTSILTDVPPVGTWYYRVQRVPATVFGGSAVYRSVATRIDFTGKPVGPAVVSLTVYPSRIDIGFTADPEALAYVLERSPDGKDWATADTVSVLDVVSGVLRDKPPADGFWSYRIRTVRKDMSVTEPGTSLPGLTLFTFGPQYDNSLQAYIENKGTRIDVTTYGAYNFVFYLMRSDKGEWKDGKRVDSLKYNESKNILTDTPPKGAWYYWVQREPTVPGVSDIIYRSQPTRVEFTGAPEITALSKSQSGIQLSFPYITGPSVLEIYRSSGNPDDLAGYVMIKSLDASSFSSTYLDASVAGTTGFYHYRLASRSGIVLSDLGAVKSVYFEAAAGSGLSPVLIKATAP